MDLQTSLPAEDTLLINTSGVIQENVMLTFKLIISNNFSTVETEQFEFCKFSHCSYIIVDILSLKK